ncbi:MAG: hypothetical protein HQK51_20500 [Oligoflexia bacterium]|nr:hypothetical protein [Oligoflexia bacterium]
MRNFLHQMEKVDKKKFLLFLFIFGCTVRAVWVWLFGYADASDSGQFVASAQYLLNYVTDKNKIRQSKNKNENSICQYII